MPQAAGRVQAVALVLPGSGVAGERVQRVPVERGLDRAVGALARAERAVDLGAVTGPLTGGQFCAHVRLHFDIVGVSGANEYSVNPLALFRTVAPPIFAVFRPPAAALWPLLPPEGVPDELHAAGAAAPPRRRPAAPAAAGGGFGRWPATRYRRCRGRESFALS